MSAFTRLAPGLLVTKPAQNLPQTATANLYTVTGGAVLVTGLLGIVSTALGATVTTLALGVTGNNTALATAATVTSGAAGSFYVPVNTAGVGGAPLFSSAPFVSATSDRLNPFLVNTGNINWTTSANNTGQMRWLLWYVPVDASATIT